MFSPKTAHACTQGLHDPLPTPPAYRWGHSLCFVLIVSAYRWGHSPEPAACCLLLAACCLLLAVCCLVLSACLLPAAIGGCLLLLPAAAACCCCCLLLLAAADCSWA
jgi:hypothetical protein